MNLPSAHDVWFLVRALLTRPGDVPGILRRGKARSAAAGAGPADELAVLTMSWRAAVRANAFLAPPGNGNTLTYAAGTPLSLAVTKLQSADAVIWATPADRTVAALSFEAARLGLPQYAENPEDLLRARQAFIGEAAIDEDVRRALSPLADVPVERGR